MRGFVIKSLGQKLVSSGNQMSVLEFEQSIQKYSPKVNNIQINNIHLTNNYPTEYPTDFKKMSKSDLKKIYEEMLLNNVS